MDAVPPEVDPCLHESVAETHNPIAVGHAPVESCMTLATHSSNVKAVEAQQNYTAIKASYKRLILFQLIDCFALIG